MAHDRSSAVERVFKRYRKMVIAALAEAVLIAVRQFLESQGLTPWNVVALASVPVAFLALYWLYSKKVEKAPLNSSDKVQAYP